MNTQTFNTLPMRSIVVAFAAAAMLLVISIRPSFGQKQQSERVTTLDALTAASFMTNGEISDELDGTDDEYVYKFKAGPGKLTVTVEVAANETNAGATVDLLGSNNRAVVSNMLVQAVDGGSERVTKNVNLAKTQDIIIRIKGLRYGSSSGYSGIYKIRLEGTAVSFKDVAPFDVPVEVKKPDVAPSDVPVEVKKPDVTPSEVPVEVKKPDVAPADVPVEVKKPAEAPSDVPVEVKKPAEAPSDGTAQGK
ncbi:MAG TPA: hypothetical protein VNA17_04650, partial [Pyrinomonadaceae bacterium]|nr:hypothetical protein [Pyrinomonadaceae bacterium]